MESEILISLTNSMMKLWEGVILFAPKLLTALLLLLFGMILSKWVGRIVAKVLSKIELNKVSEKIGLAQLLTSMKISPDLSYLIGKLCSWFVMLIFIISIADILSLQALSSIIDSLILYIPNVVAALVVFFVSSAAAFFAKETVMKMGESLKLDFSKPLAGVVYFAVMLIGVVLAVGQLKIETAFLTQIIQIILFATGGALCLSLGLGSRDVSKNIISGVYLKDSLSVGSKVKVGSYEGELVGIKSVSFEIRDPNGKKVVLPNSRLLDCELIEG